MAIRSEATWPAVIALTMVISLAACGGSAQPTAPTLQPSATTPTPPPAAPTAAPMATQIMGRCPTPAEVAEIDRDFVLTYEADTTAGTVTCPAAESSRNLTLLQTQTYRAFIMAKALTFTAPLPWTSNTLYGWLASSIRGLRFRSDIATSFCCGPTATPNLLVRPELAPLVSPADPRALAQLLLLIVHEARHANGLPHTCGENDNTVAELGAWGAQYHLNSFLADRTSPDFWPSRTQELLRSDARVLCSRFCREACVNGAFP